MAGIQTPTANPVNTWSLNWVNGDAYTITVLADGTTWLNVTSQTNGKPESFQFNLSDWLSTAPQVVTAQDKVLASARLCPFTQAVGTTGDKLTCDLPKDHSQPMLHHDPATGAFWLPPS